MPGPIDSLSLQHAGAMTPQRWARSLSAPPRVSSEATGWHGALLRRWSGTSPTMEQPPLDHHYLVMHLGGAKQVSRRHDAAAVSTIVENHSLTLVPAGTAFSWRTRGPIAFAHLYIDPAQLKAVIENQLQRDFGDASLIERVGCRDALIEPAMQAMLTEIEHGSQASKIKLDCLLESLLLKVARRHLSQSSVLSAQPVALAPHRLRRVLDLIETALASDLRLDDLARAAGSSQYHFSRAFALATGCSPYRYLLQRRVEYARILLLSSDEPLAAIARRSGFSSQRQFAVMFGRIAGVCPKRFQLQLRPRGSRLPQAASDAG